MTINSILSGEKLAPGDFEYHWQHFVLDRQEDLFKKMRNSELLPGRSKVSEELSYLLDKVAADMGSKLSQDIQEAIVYQESTATYIHYHKGYWDGIKFALMIGQL